MDAPHSSEFPIGCRVQYRTNRGDRPIVETATVVSHTGATTLEVATRRRPTTTFILTDDVTRVLR